MVEGAEKKVIMEAKFRAVPMTGESFSPYFSGEKGYVDIGGFEVSVPGYSKSIPFDFESTAGNSNEDGTYSFGNWDGFLEKVFDVDPCHEDDWAENGLQKKDITAKLLSSANRLDEFYFDVSDENDRPIPCFLEVKDMSFTDENEQVYSIRPEVLKTYNILRVAEEVAEFVQPKANYLERLPLIDGLLKQMQDKDPAGVLKVISFIQGDSNYESKKRDIGDFLIDSVLELSVSRDSVFRVGLVACGNPDYYEDPERRLPGTDARYFYGSSVRECQEAVWSYINKYDLGGGHFVGGMVYQGGNYIGNISYNGRFWDKESEYGSIKGINKTGAPKWDAEICGYGKNLFFKELWQEKGSVDKKKEREKKPKIKKKEDFER